jgi:hypothetical protein
MAGMPQFSTGKGRRVAGWVFVVVAAVLLLLAVLGAIGSRGTGDAGGTAVGIGVIVVAAAGSGLLGRHLLRERSGAPTHRGRAALVTAWVCFAISALAGAGTVALVITWAVQGLSDPIGLVYPASSSLAMGQLGRVLLASSRRARARFADDAPEPSAPGPSARPDCPAASHQVRYREACSNVNVVWTLLAVALLAFGVWLLAALGKWAEQSGPQGFLVMVPVLPGLWLVFVLFSMPYGIVLREGWLQAGVRGVPTVGRMWLRAQLPLDAVIAWDVVSRSQFRARKADYHPVPGKPFGAMMGLRVQHVCWIEAEPQFVREYFPDVFMQGNYGVTSARAAGYTQNGLVYIGTRRPRALERALSSALPGRRLEAGSDAGRAVTDPAADTGRKGVDLGA